MAEIMNQQQLIDYYVGQYSRGELSHEEMQIVVDCMFDDGRPVACYDAKGHYHTYTSRNSANGYPTPPTPVQLEAMGLIKPLDIFLMFAASAGKFFAGASAVAQKAILSKEKVLSHLEHSKSNEWRKVVTHYRNQRKADKDAKKVERDIDVKKQKKENEKKKKEEDTKKEATATSWDKIKSNLLKYGPFATAGGAAVVSHQAAPIIAEAIIALGDEIEHVYQRILSAMENLWKEHGELIMQELREIRSALIAFFDGLKSWLPYIVDFISLLRNSGPAMEDIRKYILEPFSKACKDLPAMKSEMKQALQAERLSVDSPVPKVSGPNWNPERFALYSSMLNMPIIGPMILKPELYSLLYGQYQLSHYRGWDTPLHELAAAAGYPGPLQAASAGASALSSLSSEIPKWFIG